MKVVIKKSTNKDKKMMAIFYDDNDKKIKTTHFGASGYTDFIKSGGDEKKKQAYLDRHRTNENWNDYMSAGSLSRWTLWNKKTLSASIADYKSRFKLK
jgi:hypothetical protein